MSNVSKGNTNQRRARRYYEAMGYRVEVVKRSKWCSGDFFGLWDLICIGDHDIIFAQIKTNERPDREWMQRAENWQCPRNCQKEILVYYDYDRKGDVPRNRIVFPSQSA